MAFCHYYVAMYIQMMYVLFVPISNVNLSKHHFPIFLILYVTLLLNECLLILRTIPFQHWKLFML